MSIICMSNVGPGAVTFGYAVAKDDAKFLMPALLDSSGKLAR